METNSQSSEIGQEEEEIEESQSFMPDESEGPLKPFTGTNILHSVMLLLLEVNFNIKLVLVKIRKILGQIKPKTLQQRAKIYLI